MVREQKEEELNGGGRGILSSEWLRRRKAFASIARRMRRRKKARLIDQPWTDEYSMNAGIEEKLSTDLRETAGLRRKRRRRVHLPHKNNKKFKRREKRPVGLKESPSRKRAAGEDSLTEKATRQSRPPKKREDKKRNMQKERSGLLLGKF